MIGPLGPAARVAAYYAPLTDDPLHIAAAIWFGRDADSGAMLEQPDLPDIAAITADAGSYGFHATLKAPMRLRPDTTWKALRERAQAIAGGLEPFALPPLEVTDLAGFLALCETARSAALQEFADACVAGLDDFRAPPDAAELARRRPARLTAARANNLERWGYPDVFDTWQFHMTLTRRLNAAERAIYQPSARAHFAAALAVPRRVVDLCLFVAASPDAPFTIAARLPFGR